MSSSDKNPKVDFFFNKASQWQEEYGKLRSVLLGCQLTEELKWGVPCYTFQGGNIALIHGFKEYCAIMFVKGSLLPDPQGILIQQTKNVQAGRQIRFTNIQEINGLEATITNYIYNAIEVESAGLTVDYTKDTEYDIPEEFQARLDESPDLQAAFEALTPGRKRQYITYFTEPKQSKTRTARVDKCMSRIMEGKGLSD
ncbi:YdeI/OmpD-associated family protein [Paenibacillus sp. MMS20-IR301]|uniref:YdeI/OmpD-associated family protein n=1 Tax=Paenibacillus sp. MMS20-IR301 TaxID=2895946 RepID=UPI0028F0753F|nr:YdeI/OmpD-associated family protein [Paenibacillus sp. MMS20-IR301]WNS45821.1 YdeI/OmpD-associated family protein [Paenibacillus sp. MMS20-IR301]